MRQVLERARYLSVVAVLALLVAAIITSVWGVAKTVEFGRVLVVDEGWKGSLALVELLEVIDTFLLATVLLIFSIGLYELFVGDLDVPAWLQIDSLTRLKGKLSDVIILVLAIKFLEIFATSSKKAEDVLFYGIAVALVGGLLIAFNVTRQGDGH